MEIHFFFVYGSVFLPFSHLNGRSERRKPRSGEKEDVMHLPFFWGRVSGNEAITVKTISAALQQDR